MRIHIVENVLKLDFKKSLSKDFCLYSKNLIMKVYEFQLNKLC